VIIPEPELKAFLDAKHAHPHAWLGLHPVTHKRKKGLVARAFLRDAVSCELVDYTNKPEKRYPMEKVAKEGFFEVFIPERKEVFPYRLRELRQNGEIRQFYDPYSFLPSISDHDLYLFGEGNEFLIYKKFGAHLREMNGVPGVSFAVWAPNARRVSVVGDFNQWDGRFHPMRSMGASGVWEIFIPGLQEGEKYKYEIHGADDYLHLKTDPYGTFFEAPPHNASIICDIDHYAWNDQDWMEKRRTTNWQEKPVSIYEVHPGSWKRVVDDGYRPLTYRELAAELVDYVKQMGFTHVEFMPLAEHPFSGSWGYQVTGFFAPTHRYGSPEDFQYLIDVLHQNGIGVIVDWVPGHFPMDAFALANFDGTHLYEHADPRQGFHMDWGTYIFNYGRNEVRCFLISNALAWMERFHIDGLRVDAVASMLYLDYSRNEGEWIPNQYGGNENLEAISFLRTTNDLVHQWYPGALMIAEESTAFSGVTKPTDEGGLGFDLKWNMGWMHDSLEYFQKDPIHRKWHHNNLTFGMIYQYSEHFTQVYSHDEVVHGKGSMIMKMAAEPMSAKSANLRALYALMWLWPGKKTLFMGSEIGQSQEWSYDQQVQWDLLQYLDHNGIQMTIRDLNNLYRQNKALHVLDNRPEGFQWIAADDTNSSVIAFLRKGENPEDTLLVVGHYTPVARQNYRIGVPFGGYWREVINTDSEFYGGQGAGNMGGLQADPVEAHGQRYSLELTLPGPSTLAFQYEG